MIRYALSASLWTTIAAQAVSPAGYTALSGTRTESYPFGVVATITYQ